MLVTAYFQDTQDTLWPKALEEPFAFCSQETRIGYIITTSHRLPLQARDRDKLPALNLTVVSGRV